MAPDLEIALPPCDDSVSGTSHNSFVKFRASDECATQYESSSHERCSRASSSTQSSDDVLAVQYQPAHPTAFLLIYFTLVVGPATSAVIYHFEFAKQHMADKGVEWYDCVLDVIWHKMKDINQFKVEIFPFAIPLFYIFVMVVLLEGTNAKRLFQYRKLSTSKNLPNDPFATYEKALVVWSIFVVSLWCIWLHSFLQTVPLFGGCSFSASSMQSWNAGLWTLAVLKISFGAAVALPSAFLLVRQILIPKMNTFSDLFDSTAWKRSWRHSNKVAIGLAVVTTIAIVVEIVLIPDESFHLHHWQIGYFLVMILAPFDSYLRHRIDVHRAKLSRNSECLASEEEYKWFSPRGWLWFLVFYHLVVQGTRLGGIALLTHGLYVWGPASWQAIATCTTLCISLCIYQLLRGCKESDRHGPANEFDPLISQEGKLPDRDPGRVNHSSGSRRRDIRYSGA
jgi:hypothetical protein